ncbi:MAG: OmpA family protein [Salibacteraceae bacterium]
MLKSRFLLSLCTLICGWNWGFAQNLVPNAGFEYYYQCPNDHDQLSRAIGWYKTNLATPDFFHECNTSNQSFYIPKNVFGVKETFSGEGYAGMVCRRDFREYLMVRLKSPLEKGQEYYAYMHVSLSSASEITTDELGMFFSTRPIFSEDFKPITRVKPQIRNPKGRYIQQDQWYKIEGQFVANGGERYLILGNFQYSYATQKVSSTTDGVTASPYFYIDNVSTEPIPKLALRKELQTIKRIDNIYFPSGRASLLPAAEPVLDSLAGLLLRHTELRLRITGHTDSVGNATTNLRLSEQRASRVAQYLIEQGVAADRLEIRAMGYSKPISKNGSEPERQLNRRVTFEALVKGDAP